jgi:hypothetical protein
VERVLQSLDPSRDEAVTRVTRRLVDAAVKRALEPWTKGQTQKAAIETVLFRARLECSMMDDPEWHARGQEAAAEAIRRLQDGATQPEMEKAGEAALQRSKGVSATGTMQGNRRPRMVEARQSHH